MASTSLSCLHRFITGEEAEEILKVEGKDGSFLLRPSSVNADDLSLSVRRKNEIVHIRIQNTGDYFDLYGGEQFSSLPQLIEYYTIGEGKNQLVERNGNTISMKYPVLAPMHRQERWFHANMTSVAAEEKLRNSNKEGTFLVRESSSKTGDFVLSCLTKEYEVVHVIIKKEKGRYVIGDGEAFRSLRQLIDYYRSNPLTVKQGSGNKLSFNLQKSLNEGGVHVAKLDLRIAELEKEFQEKIKPRNGFWEEFENLRQSDGKDAAYTGLQVAGALPENKKKNRYRNILPYDDTRVKLKNVDPKVPGSDYINANYVTAKLLLPHIKKSYIATQGCVKATVSDFWNMVWQEKIYIIVMITELVENQKNKCHQYWPDLKEDLVLPMFQGAIAVHLKSEEGRNDNEYSIRTFDITHNNETRTVFQYQHHKWPDKCTPTDVSRSIDFVLDISKKAKEISLPESAYWLVHCSAGIGRTGCFILIDLIISDIKVRGIEATIDISKLLLNIRGQRDGLVQTDKQYTFVYKAVQFYVNKYLKGTAVYSTPSRPPVDTGALIYENV